MNDHAKWLRQAAKEIAAEGHNGWGNTCTDAADEIERLEAHGAMNATKLARYIADNTRLRDAAMEFLIAMQNSVHDIDAATCHAEIELEEALTPDKEQSL